MTREPTQHDTRFFEAMEGRTLMSTTGLQYQVIDDTGPAVEPVVVTIEGMESDNAEQPPIARSAAVLPQRTDQTTPLDQGNAFPRERHTAQTVDPAKVLIITGNNDDTPDGLSSTYGLWVYPMLGSTENDAPHTKLWVLDGPTQNPFTFRGRVVGELKPLELEHNGDTPPADNNESDDSDDDDGNIDHLLDEVLQSITARQQAEVDWNGQRDTDGRVWYGEFKRYLLAPAVSDRIATSAQTPDRGGEYTWLFQLQKPQTDGDVPVTTNENGSDEENKDDGEQDDNSTTPKIILIDPMTGGQINGVNVSGDSANDQPKPIKITIVDEHGNTIDEYTIDPIVPDSSDQPRKFDWQGVRGSTRDHNNGARGVQGGFHFKLSDLIPPDRDAAEGGVEQ